MPTIDPLPGILNLFSETKVVRDPVNHELESYLQGLGGTASKNTAANQNDFSKYYGALNAATPQFNQLNQGGIDYIGDLLKKPVDGAANYKDLLGFNLGQLNNQQNMLDQAGSRGDNLALAALGLGGRSGGGSYGSLARTNRISANTVPILNTIFGNTGQTAQSVSDQNFRQNLFNMGLLDKRLGMADNPANRLLAPISARNNMLNSDAATGANIANATRSNILGLREETDMLGKIAALGNSMTNDNMNELAGMVGSAYGGGGGGMPQQRSAFNGSGWTPYGGGMTQDIGFGRNPSGYMGGGMFSPSFSTGMAGPQYASGLGLGMV